MRLVVAAIGTVAVLTLAGCGGSGIVSRGPGNLVSLQEPIVLGVPAVDDGLQERWRDVAGFAYSTAFMNQFLYSSTPYVTASFANQAPELIITLEGTSLKPNFAYQVKLEGLPQTDPGANQILRSLGRRYRNLGYLIFGYFVTDENGDITRCETSPAWQTAVRPPNAMLVDSSYHVLWRTDDRSPGAVDGPTIDHTVVQASYGYDVDPPQTGPTVGVYGEWEPGRPAPGDVVLPDGSYTCLLRLSEETFHELEPGWTSMWDGWKSVLDAQISFTIDSGGGGGTGPRAMTVQGTVVTTKTGPGPFRTAEATVTVVEVDSEGQVLGSVSGATVSGVWGGAASGTSEAVTDASGVAKLTYKARNVSGLVTFDVTGLVGPTADYEWDGLGVTHGEAWFD